MRPHLAAGLYLLGAVLSNVLAAKFGYKASLIIGLVLIPLNLFTRDILHERWKGRLLYLRLGCIILAGSVLSYTINVSAYQIAVASFFSFLASGITDTTVYQLAYKYTSEDRYFRMNLSNLFSSFVDSFVFFTLAFSGVPIYIMLFQSILKFIGGMGWTYLYKKHIIKL